MTSSRTPRYLILGGGAVVTEFHLPALAKLGWIESVRVADVSAEAVRRVAKQFPDVDVFEADYHAALDQATGAPTDGVIVALPNAYHEDAVTQAMALGFDVLCEKPLALSREACERLASAAKASKRVLAVGMVRRFLPSVQALRRGLAAGWIGDIQSIEARDGGPFEWASESGQYFRPENAGVVANLGVHLLDLIEYVSGPPAPRRYWDDWGGGVEANAEFVLDTAAGAPVRVLLSYTHELEHTLRLRGTRGEIWIDHHSDRAYLRAADAKLDAQLHAAQPFARGAWPPTLLSSFLEQFADFHSAIVQRRAPCATAREAARTAGLIDWAYAHHTRPVSVQVAGPRPAASFGEGRIVVTGGTGFVGGHLIEALAEAGARDVFVPVRSYQTGANAGRFPVRLARVSLLDRRALRPAMEGARHVFHLAFGRDGADAARVTVEGTKRVVEAAIEAGVESVVVVSTTAVLGDPGATGGDESLPYAPRNEYERLKAEAERWALARAADSGGTRIVVINAACVYGPRGRTFTELPARLLRDRALCWIDDGRGVVNHVFVRNLVDVLLLAATHPSAHGQRFIASDGATTWRAFFIELFGRRVDRLSSYTRDELDRLARAQTPGLKDLARAVVNNAEMWRVVRENPSLARAKRLARHATPRLYQRALGARQTSHREAGTEAPVVPPVWIADLYGPSETTLSADKARHAFGWTPRIDLVRGQTISREWLEHVQLLDGL